MSRLSDVIDEHIGAIARKVALDIDQRVVLKTPVDTGRLRSNWLVGIGRAVRRSVVTVDKAGQTALQQGAEAVSRAQPYETIYISNNLRYAQQVEGGSSKQAPAGMAAISVAEVTRVFGAG